MHIWEMGDNKHEQYLPINGDKNIFFQTPMLYILTSVWVLAPGRNILIFLPLFALFCTFSALKRRKKVQKEAKMSKKKLAAKCWFTPKRWVYY